MVRSDHTAPIDILTNNLPLGNLLALGTQMRSDVSPDMLLQDVAVALARVLEFEQVYVRLRNPDTDVLEARAFTGLPEQTIARLRAAAIAPAQYRSLFQPRYRISQSYLVPQDPDLAFDDGLNTHTLLVPLLGSANRLFGAIYLNVSAAPQSINAGSVRIVETIARQAAFALEHASMATRMQRMLKKEQLLTRLGLAVSSTLDLQTILRATTNQLGHAFSTGAILLVQEQKQLTMVASTGITDMPDSQHYLAAGRWTMDYDLPFLSNDLATEQRIPAASGSLIASPLRSGGRAIGTLLALAGHANAFTYEDVDLLEAIATQVGGPISGAQLYQQTQHLAEEIRRRNDQLLVINALAELAVSTMELNRMLDEFVHQIQQGFGYKYIELFIVNEETKEAEIVAYTGQHEQLPSYKQSLYRGILGRSYRTGRPELLDDVHSDAEYIPAGNAGNGSELCVPVIANDRVLALLNLESHEMAAFSDEDIEILSTVSGLLASALENARLSCRAQEAAVLEERSRLARDLHDSVTQQLFSMTLTTQAARAQLEKNPARAAMQLERLQETASAALAEMRALIFQLRPPGLGELGLISALHHYILTINQREGLDVMLEVSGDEREARNFEQAIYRIVQEALNNIVKHAGPCRAEVILTIQPQQIELSIRDNGHGFDVSEQSKDLRHFGVIGMRERTTEIGGYFDIVSEPDHGTTVMVIIPRNNGRRGFH